MCIRDRDWPNCAATPRGRCSTRPDSATLSLRTVSACTACAAISCTQAQLTMILKMKMRKPIHLRINITMKGSCNRKTSLTKPICAQVQIKTENRPLAIKILQPHGTSENLVEFYNL